MTTLSFERLGFGSSRRDERALDDTYRTATDGLAGRTVWCAAALPAGRDSARRLEACLGWDGDIAAGHLDIAATEPLTDVARRLDAMLAGAMSAAPGSLGPAEEDAVAGGTGAAEAAVGAQVRPGDVVILHDALTAVLARAVRERGAHAVWRVRSTARPAAEALEFLRRWTPGVDAYVIVRGHVIAAAMPSPDAVSAMELADDRYDSAGWGSVLAAVVHDDRAEHVGGTRHARPAVALR